MQLWRRSPEFGEACECSAERVRERDMENCLDRSPLKAADGSSTEGMDECQVLMGWM